MLTHSGQQHILTVSFVLGEIDVVLLKGDARGRPPLFRPPYTFLPSRLLKWGFHVFFSKQFFA
jgi:hypothetical protein